MEPLACIRLPFLRASEETVQSCRSLWPGHGPTPAHAWAPTGYPLDHEAASAFLDALVNISLPELEMMRQTFSVGKIMADINILDEMAALARFAGNRPGTGALDLARTQAQKALLWRWLWEGSLAEIAALEAECNAAEQALPSFFQDNSASVPHASRAVKVIQFDSWRSTTANAAVFIPTEMPILVEGRMAEDLTEILEFAPLSDTDLLEARAPLWQALGLSRPVTGIAENIYNLNRSWLRHLTDTGAQEHSA